MTILILDDEKQSRTLIRKYLEDQFPQIIAEEVSTLAEAKKSILNKSYGIVFLDIHLNGGTSFDLLDNLKGIKAQIIFITAYSEFAIKAFKYSAVDYLVKPIDPDEFQMAVQKAIHHYGQSNAQPIVRAPGFGYVSRKNKTCFSRKSMPPFISDYRIRVKAQFILAQAC